MREPADLCLRLRAGDEAAFRWLVKRHHASLMAVARTFVRNRATAEEVVQDTWLAVIEGIEAFEQRSSLKNWIFAILANMARCGGVREGRMIPVADFNLETSDDEPVVDPARFDASGSWADLPTAWEAVTPERIVAGKQMLAHVRDAIERLPPAQRSVLILREIENMESPEVSAVLGMTEGNQRVLLHRARARVRNFMEQLLGK